MLIRLACIFEVLLRMKTSTEPAMHYVSDLSLCLPEASTNPSLEGGAEGGGCEANRFANAAASAWASPSLCLSPARGERT
jgi:hypothetical protein